jgi:hypothetical protein
MRASSIVVASCGWACAGKGKVESVGKGDMARKVYDPCDED